MGLQNPPVKVDALSFLFWKPGPAPGQLSGGSHMAATGALDLISRQAVVKSFECD